MSVETSTMFVTGMAVRNVMTPGVAGSVKFTSPVGVGKKGSMIAEVFVEMGGLVDAVPVGVKESVGKVLKGRERLGDGAPQDSDQCHLPRKGAPKNGVAPPVKRC